MDVLELKPQDTGEWDDYVYSSPSASPFHLSGWQWVFEEIFNLTSHFLLAKEGEHILGVLPLLVIESRLTGRHITSMPGGICTDSARAAIALTEFAKDMVRKYHAPYLILRDSQKSWDLPGLVTDENHCTMLVRLPEDPDEIWWGLRRQVRQDIKRAIRSQVEVVNGTESLQHYYPIYARAMRDLGTPSLGLNFFRAIMRQFPAIFRILLVQREDLILGGGFVAHFRGTIYNTWAGMLRQHYDLRPNYLLYWDTLKFGCEHGFDWVDLGRCKRGSGSFEFKKKWVSESRPLYQQFFLNGISRPPPVGGSRAEDPQYRLFVKLWRLTPLPITEFLGPWLRKSIPFG